MMNVDDMIDIIYIHSRLGFILSCLYTASNI